MKPASPFALSTLIFVSFAARGAAAAVAPTPAAPPTIKYDFAGTAVNIGDGRLKNSQDPGRFDGVLAGTAKFASDALALDFDNSQTAYLQAEGSETLTFGQGVTLSATVVRRSNTTEDGIISKWFGTDQWLLTFYPGGNGRLIFTVALASGHFTLEYPIPATTNYLNKPIDIVASYSPTEGQKLYWAGTLVKQSLSGHGPINPGANPIHVGDSGPAWSTFDGRISNVWIWAPGNSQYSWGTDTDQCKACETPLFFPPMSSPSQDFMMVWLGHGLEAADSNAVLRNNKLFAASKAPKAATYGFWTLFGPGGVGRDREVTEYDWGVAQAQHLIDEVTGNDDVSSKIGGRVLFADVEGRLDGASVGSWSGTRAENTAVVSGFLDRVACRTPSSNACEGFTPGIYTGSAIWEKNFDSAQVDVPFVLWLAAWLQRCDVWEDGKCKTWVPIDRLDPRKPDFLSVEVENVFSGKSSPFLDAIKSQIGATRDHLRKYHPALWQFQGDAGDISLQDPAHFAPRPANTVGLSSTWSLTFDYDVSAGGSSTMSAIAPSNVGTLPAGMTVFEDNAVDIRTTSTYTGSITIAFKATSVTDPSVFARLRILHGEGGVLVDRTASDPPPDFDTKTISARVTSLSPFVVALLPPNHPPVAACRNVTLAIRGGCTANVSSAEIDFGSSDPDGDVVTLAMSPEGPFSPGNHDVALTATDEGGLSSSCSAVITVVDEMPPALECPASKSMANDLGVCAAAVDVGSPSAFDDCTVATLGGVRSDGQPMGSLYPVGTTDTLWTATDPAGNSSSCSQAITVADSEPPMIRSVSATPTILWPPNHKMVSVQIAYSAGDNCAPAPPACALEVTSNEPGDGATQWDVLDAHRVNLRAERLGAGAGRSYTVRVTCADTQGNASTATTTVTVPHDASH